MSGPLSVKHVGLCTHEGPNEMLGQLKIQFTRKSAAVAATLSSDGRECTYHGLLSQSATGCYDRLSLQIVEARLSVIFIEQNTSGSSRNPLELSGRACRQPLVVEMLPWHSLA